MREQTSVVTGQHVPAQLRDFESLRSALANARASRPVIQGLYLLFGGGDQRPLAVLDSMAPTNVRTAAVSGMGARRLAAPGANRLVVFGTGVQAWEHIRAFNGLFDLTVVEIVGRTAAHAERLAALVRGLGLESRIRRLPRRHPRRRDDRGAGICQCLRFFGRVGDLERHTDVPARDPVGLQPVDHLPLRWIVQLESRPAGVEDDPAGLDLALERLFLSQAERITVEAHRGIVSGRLDDQAQLADGRLRVSVGAHAHRL
ncbi:hypothetical protein E3T33_01355 [Cryobacterium sp. TMT1-2-1]|nr:hypothetical protein E3T33_01355 [Cryobacterium sp. TMT1-2-1]TFD86722.1 hypothetical protein E3T56_06845 [Cryobacterium psychrotolerans]